MTATQHRPTPAAAVPPGSTALLAACLAVYTVSFFLRYDGNGIGAEMFLLGLYYCYAVPLSIPWWANVIFILGLFRLGAGHLVDALVTGLLAFVLSALHLALWERIPTGPAYYCWAGSMGLLAAGAAVISYLSRPRRAAML